MKVFDSDANIVQRTAAVLFFFAFFFPKVEDKAKMMCRDDPKSAQLCMRAQNQSSMDRQPSVPSRRKPQGPKAAI